MACTRNLFARSPLYFFNLYFSNSLQDIGVPGARGLPDSDSRRATQTTKRTFDRRRHVEPISCTRCGEEKTPLEKPPFRNELGERIHGEICRDCWSDWLQHQTILINHYGLDVRDPNAREFLYEKIEELLLEGGTDENIDTTLEGSIEW